MLLHYVTGVGILLAGAIHLATVFLVGSYLENLAFSGNPYSVIEIYRNVILAMTLELLLVFVSYHALNGLRVILVELYQGGRWEFGVKWSLIALGVLIIIYGTRTILLAHSI